MRKLNRWCVMLLIAGLSTSNAILAAPEYSLDSEKSSLYFVSTKKTHIVENHYFTNLSGSISEFGEAKLNIDLSSAETGVAIRNQRLRELLFEVVSYSQATVTLSVDAETLDAQEVGSVQVQNVSATLNLHGVSSPIATNLIVTKLSNSTLMVQNASPIIIVAGDYNLATGVDALKNVANLDVISYAVPVNFTLLFNTQ